MKHLTSVHLPSPPLPPQCCCMEHHKQLEPGSPASVECSCSHRVSLALPFCPPVPLFLSGRPRAWGKKKQFLPGDRGWKSCGVQSFPTVLCDPEPGNHEHLVSFFSSWSHTEGNRWGFFEKYHSLCKVEGFFKLNFEV